LSILEEHILPLENRDKDYILHHLSDQIFIENLEKQLTTLCPNYYNINILDIFNDRYNFILAKYGESSNWIKDTINQTKFELYEFIKKEIESRFDINTNLDYSYIDINYFYYIARLYEFFVIDYKSNVIKFLSSYILSEKQFLAQEYRDITIKKDLGIISIKKIFSKFDDVIIIANIEDIVKNIILNFEDAELVLELLYKTNDSEISTNAMVDLFINTKYNSNFGNNFCHNFLNPFLDINIWSEVIFEVKSELIKTFPKK